MIRTTPGSYRNTLGCTPGGNCCSECSGHMGQADDSTSFADFLAANPELQTQQLAYQQANPGDPALQTVMFNPVTNTMGPVTLPPAPAAIAPAAAYSTTSSTGILIIAGAIVGGLILMQSIEGGTTSTGTRKRR
jgi:hypothetical protein